ncbi:MAG: hypothetical protein GY708_18270 [Actinomycetia bacterium]|nr:hypothetical protein [Actinomycetes bacterium]MCP4959152.1 hypothetical protein [Actinomycetes bacterium]
MWYLVTKITLLLIAAFALGAVFGRLLPRRERPGEAESLDVQAPAEEVPDEQALDLTAGGGEEPPHEKAEPEPEVRPVPDIVDSVDDSFFAVLGQPLPAVAGAAAGQAAEPVAEDLKQIFGIGPKIEQLLHDYGITRIQQLAELDQAGVDELQSYLSEFPERIERDDWVGQARRLLD